MEIFTNKDERLRNAIAFGSAKNLQRFFIDKMKLENLLIAQYENSYKFMEVTLLYSINEISQKINSTNNDDKDILLAYVNNFKNHKKIDLYYNSKHKKYFIKFLEYENIGINEKILSTVDLDTNIMNSFMENVTKNKIGGFLKKKLYDYNISRAKE